MAKRIKPMTHAEALRLPTYEEAMGHVRPIRRKNSRAKGKRSELEARDLLRRCGITDAERGARNGVKSGADIHSPMLQAKGWRVEVKNVAGMRVGNALWYAACRQAECDAEHIGKWFLLWRPCRGQWALSKLHISLGFETIVGEVNIAGWIKGTIIQEGSINAKA